MGVFHVGCACFPREFLRRTVASRFLNLVWGASGHDLSSRIELWGANGHDLTSRIELWGASGHNLTSRIELSRINQECQSCCGNGIKSLATIEWGGEWCSRVQMGAVKNERDDATVLP
jgi:hypothetical protein